VRLALKLVAIGSALLAAASTVSAAVAENAHRALKANPCSAWSVRTLLSGQGWLENLAFERGSMSLSALAQGKLLRLREDGQLSTLLTPVTAPGGQQPRGRFLYFNTGDTVPIAPTGTIDRLNLRTGKRSVYSSGLTMPNGLAFLPNGDAVVTGAVPATIGVTRIHKRDPAHPQLAWAQIADTNGVAVDPTGRWLYVDRDPPASNDGEVDRVLISNPRRVEVVGHLGAGSYPDDMTIDRRGILYIAGFLSGTIYRVDPYTHSSCAIATGLQQPTSAKFGGPGWNREYLYVTAASGNVYALALPRRR
jgi:SMP-30/Gluconolactonase/LRE-like region